MTDMLHKMQMLEAQCPNSEAKVCRILLDEPSLVRRYTITTIAELAETSTSAVLRFCQTLGYRGYKDFRYDMLQYLDARDEQGESPSGDPVTQIVGCYSSAVSALDRLDRSQLERLSDDILSANVVYAIGAHRSSLPAMKLRFNLEDSGILCVASGDSIAFSHNAVTMDDRSLVIIFSVSGHTSIYHNFLSSIADHAPKLWLITSNPNAKMKKAVSETIVLPSANFKEEYTLEDHPIMMAFVELISHMTHQKRMRKKS